MARNVIIVGYGRVGRHVADQLSEDRNTVTIIERDPEQCDQVSSKVSRVIQGSGADPEVLGQIDFSEVDVFAALADDIEVNLAACEIVHDRAPHVKTVLRIGQDGEQDYGHRRFVDSIVYPAAAGAIEAVERITTV